MTVKYLLISCEAFNFSCAFLFESQLEIYPVFDYLKRREKNGKMLRGKIRMHTCRIILFTSLAWFFLDLAVLLYFSDSSPKDASASAAGNRAWEHGAAPHDPLLSVPLAAAAQQAKRDMKDSPTNVANHFANAKPNLNQEPDEVGQCVFIFTLVKFFCL